MLRMNVLTKIADLLEDYDPNSDVRKALTQVVTKLTVIKDIDLVHCRISSIPDLHLERFHNIQVCSVSEVWYNRC